jgi:transcriptional regulator PpsR
MNTRESDFWNARSGPRIAPEHFGEIVATAADIAIVVGPGGTVISTVTNPLNSAIGSVAHWEGRPIATFLAPDSRDKVLRQIAATIDGLRDRPDAIEVNHADGATWDFPVRYTLHLTGRDGRVLMLGRDLRPLAELQQRLVRAQLALERDHEAQRAFETRYRVVMETVREALVLVDAGSGRIVDLNSAAARLLGGDAAGLTGTTFAQAFEGRRRGEFAEALSRAAREDGAPLAATPRAGGPEVAIRPVPFRSAGERLLLCRLELEAAGPDGPASDARDPGPLFAAAREGMVLVDDEDRIERANDAFLAMADCDSSAELRGRSMGDLLVRGTIDLKVLREGGQSAPLSTRLRTRFGSRLPVEVTAAGLGTGGRIYVLRETIGGDALRDGDAPAQPAGQDASRVQALVGSEPLRDIVASMTDVIEKQCIEAAIELTGNNRVAAAEMLGLSRQSLYVKLRKFGLLQRDEP